MTNQKIKPKSKSQILRAVGYCRTSGEKQRDNTSIPNQRNDIAKFVEQRGWELVRFYVDEAKTGSKIEGRDGFQQMVKDAAAGLFDLIVVYDVDRFARDGSDIITQTKFLKENFGIDVIDTRGFDSRDRRSVLMRFVKAGVSEEERLRILERNCSGRIARAKSGLPWCGHLPVGRGFKRTGKNSGEWYVNETGKRLAALLQRYADGEPLRDLVKEYGFSSPELVLNNVYRGQLSGVYQTRFHSPDIGIENLVIPVPAVPQIITPALEKRVRERMAHNRRSNKEHKHKYLLTGFVRCGHCGKFLAGQTQPGGHTYYRHTYYQRRKVKCPFAGVRGSLLEEKVLDYLYAEYLDEPNYKKAIKSALPSGEDRKVLLRDIEQAEHQLRAIEGKINRLVCAVADGADPALLIEQQDLFKAQKQALQNRLRDLKQTLDSLPDPKQLKEQALSIRVRLRAKYRCRDWHKLDYAEIRRYLHFLFGDNPAEHGYGIYVTKRGNEWYVRVEGAMQVGDLLTIKPSTDNKQLIMSK